MRDENKRREKASARGVVELKFGVLREPIVNSCLDACLSRAWDVCTVSRVQMQSSRRVCKDIRGGRGESGMMAVWGFIRGERRLEAP